MWQDWLGRCGNNLSQSHLYNLKSPYISMYIYACANWNNAYNKRDDFK
jgi:hypothetical protein